MDTRTRNIARDTLLTGAGAGLLSTAALLALGKYETGKAATPVNAVSHWIWGPRAYRHREVEARFTGPGFAIHQGASFFWAGLYQAAFDGRLRGRPMPAIAAGLAVSALACFVDLKMTPQRLTPGFEHKLSKTALACVYASFGIGLALSDLLRRRRR